MIGIHFFTNVEDIVEAISEPYQKNNTTSVVVKYIEDNSVSEVAVACLKSIPTTTEYDKWNKGCK